MHTDAVWLFIWLFICLNASLTRSTLYKSRPRAVRHCRLHLCIERASERVVRSSQRVAASLASSDSGYRCHTNATLSHTGSSRLVVIVVVVGELCQCVSVCVSPSLDARSCVRRSQVDQRAEPWLGRARKNGKKKDPSPAGGSLAASFQVAAQSDNSTF